MKTTKVQAIVRLLSDRGGSATWSDIYENIGKYRKGAKTSEFWKEGLRGVVYREIRAGRTFKFADKGIGIISLL